MKLDYPFGATPLDLDEISALIPPHISTQAQLNGWEQANILSAEAWAFSKKHSNLISLDFCKKLHHKMFDQTWHWAGHWRRSNKNIGVDWLHIPMQLKNLCDDVLFQLKHQSFSLEEIATRFHHRLVAIHPFSNGNGRHARLMTDLFLKSHDLERFSWGAKNIVEISKTRKDYIHALRLADRHDYQALLEFVYS